MRVAASFAVIVIHIAASRWYSTDIHSYEWQVINFWHGAPVRWAVPVFVMISGALFITKDIPFRKIYSKYIFRIICALIFWSALYALQDYRHTGRFLKSFVFGHYHLWFLFMIIGLYIIIPFMKKIAESEFLTKSGL